jgi:hypothetical protein
MKHYLGLLLIIDASPHINDKSIKWEIDTNVIIMNKNIWSNYMHNQKEDILSLFSLSILYYNNLIFLKCNCQ